MLPTIYIGALPTSNSEPTMTETGSAPTTGGTLTPDSNFPLQHMTTGEEGESGWVYITLAIPSVDMAVGTKLEVWITANSNTSLILSEYRSPSDSNLQSSVDLAADNTYILLLKKSLNDIWYIVSFVGGY